MNIYDMLGQVFAAEAGGDPPKGGALSAAMPQSAVAENTGTRIPNDYSKITDKISNTNHEIVPGAIPWALEGPRVKGEPIANASKIPSIQVGLNSLLDGTINSLWTGPKGRKQYSEDNAALKKSFPSFLDESRNSDEAWGKTKQSVGVYEPGRYGQGGISYDDIMMAAYGGPQLKLIKDALSKLYRAGTGGGMMGVDTSSPTPVRLTYRDDDVNYVTGSTSRTHGWNTLGKNRTPGLDINISNLTNADDVSGPSGKRDYLDNASKALQEEAIHEVGAEASADPSNPWGRNVRGNMRTGAYVPEYLKTGELRDPYQEGIFRVPAMNMRDTAGVPDDYLNIGEEARAKIVQAAQLMGKHPITNPGGLDKGIEDLFEWMGKNAKTNDLKSYYSNFKNADADRRNRLMLFYRKVFQNFGDNSQSGAQDQNNLGAMT